jgi:hypothetical protein
MARKHNTCSSHASSDYRSAFERGLKAYPDLTDKEKQEIFSLMNTKVLADDRYA